MGGFSAIWRDGVSDAQCGKIGGGRVLLSPVLRASGNLFGVAGFVVNVMLSGQA